MIIEMFQTKNKIIKSIAYFMLIIITTVISHWLVVNMYVKLCAMLMTLFGPIQTFISLGSPTCHFLNFTQHELSKHYITLWSGAAIGFASWLTFSNSSKSS